MTDRLPGARDTGSALAEPPTLAIEVLPTKLLYVEDDDDLREMIALAFVDAGFDVTTVPSAEAALAELQATTYDIVLTDYNLPGATGRWLLETAGASASCIG